MSDSIIKSNALKDPSYCPYCMRCPGLKRMRKVATLFWQCDCGAIHDERDQPPPESVRVDVMEFDLL